MGSDFGAGDLRPARDQLARGEPLLGIGVGKHVAEQDGKRFCVIGPGLDMGPYTTSRSLDGTTSAVMAGLVPAIHVLTRGAKKDVDARDKRGHDVERLARWD